MLLVLSGTTPSKKNSKRIVHNKRTGKPIIISSERHNDWEKQVIEEVTEQFKGLRVTNYPIQIACKLFYKTRTKRDLDNQLSSILDVLKKAGVIEDDNMNYVNKIIVEFGGFDKENPRAEVTLED